MPVRNLLLELPNVAECVVLTRPSAEGQRCLAYIVPSGPFSARDAEAHLRRSAPDAPVPDRYVLVTRLPIDAAGQIDEAALFRLPCVDDALAARAEEQLRAEPEVERVALFVEHDVPAVPAIHVSTLLDTPVTAASAAAGPPLAAPTVAASFERDPARPPAHVTGAALSAAPDKPRTLPELLAQAAERFAGPRITYVAADGSTRAQSFAELLHAARRVGAALAERSLTPGQAVLLQLTGAQDTLVAFWGCVLGGFVPVMSAVPSTYDTVTNDLDRLQHVVALFAAPPVLTSTHRAPDVTAWLERQGVAEATVLAVESLASSSAVYREPALDPDATAFYSLTSGSTGAPKAIMLSHRNLLTRASGTNQLCGYTEHDRILNWLPFDHIGSISDWHLRCVQIGCAMFYASTAYVLGDPLNWLRLMDRFRVSQSWAPNFAYALLNDALRGVEERWDLSSVQGLLTAGEAVSSRTVHAFLERLAQHGLSRSALRPAFGMAELGSGVTYYLPTEAEPIRVQYVHRGHLDGALVPTAENDPEAVGFTSLGPIVPGASMRIVDDAQRVVPELCVGRLQIAGEPVCLGYYADPDANRRVFVGDGWFDTGDRGFIARGELYLTGRDKETLIVNGANYASAEIEACAEEIDGVRISFTAACAVRARGAADERLAIFFSPTRSSPEELTRILRAIQTGVAKKTGVRPDYVIPVEPSQVPKTAIGKLQRKLLVRRFEAGEFDERLRETDRLLENGNTVPDWFLRPTWCARQLSDGSGEHAARRYWIIEDRDGLAGELARQLVARGGAVFRTPDAAAVPRDFTHVIDLTDYAPPPASRAGDAARRASALQRLAVELTARGAERTHLFVVASHAQCVASDTEVVPARAMVPALSKALGQEHAALVARHIDVPFTHDPVEQSVLAQQLAAELASHDQEDEVAYRAGQRYTPAFERVGWTGTSREPGLEAEKLYVITGGLGGVGLELGKYLLQRWRAKLLVVGRAPLDDRETDDQRTRRARWRELEALGDVVYSALDVSDAAALRRAVVERESALGLPAAGFFHLAGVYHEAALLEDSASRIAASFSPKLSGTLALHELARERPSAFVVCFSSLASVWSGAGIGTYAAANRLSDAACARERCRGVRSYSVNWSVWKGLGIGTHSAPETVLRTKGYQLISALPGMWSLEAILTREPGQFLIGVDSTSAAVRRRVQQEPRALARLRGVVSRRASSETPALLAPRVVDVFGTPVLIELVDVTGSSGIAESAFDREALLRQVRGPVRVQAPPENPIQAELLEIWKRLLNTDVIGIDDSFFDLGGTSLLSVRLFSEVERCLGVSLSPGVLLQASSVRGLAALIESESAAQPLDSLIALNRKTGSPALFLLHDAEGAIEMYQELAELLAPQLAVYGLRPYQRPSHPALHTRVEDMVAHYVARIRACQPSGPYCVGGWSSAGPLAVEVASALQAQGEHVAFVALLDATPHARAGHGALNGASPLAEQDGAPAAQGGALSTQLKAAIRHQARHIGKRGLDYARVALMQRFVDQGGEIPWFLQHIPPRAVYDFAIRKHRPSSFAGSLTLFRAKTQSDRRDYGWSSRASAVRVVEVDGEHGTLLRAPHVAHLAAEIRRRALRALATGSSSRADQEPQSAPAW